MSDPPLRLGIAGLGAIGGEVAGRVSRGEVPGVCLVGASSRSSRAARIRLDALGLPSAAMDIGALASACDVVLEAAPAHHFMEIAEPVLSAGRTLVALSAGAVLENLDRLGVARGRILIPSGAIAGLDVIRAACADGGVDRLRLVSRKSPASLARRAGEFAGLSAPARVFAGEARAAARAFPANANIAAALALSGVPPEAVEVEIWADPSATINRHELLLEGPAVTLRLEIQSTPLAANPRTSRLAAASTLALLGRMGARIQIGS